MCVREVEAQKHPMPGEFIIKNLQTFNNYHYYVINVTAQKLKKKTHKIVFQQETKRGKRDELSCGTDKRKLTTTLVLFKTIDMEMTEDDQLTAGKRAQTKHK